MKIGFDNDKYLKIQSEHIRERINQFGKVAKLTHRKLAFLYNRKSEGEFQETISFTIT